MIVFAFFAPARWPAAVSFWPRWQAAATTATTFDISSQIGADPVLPEPAPALVADMKLAEVVGWKDGQTPTVPEGLTVTAYAKDLANPRTVHTLPNGDVLVVQSRGPSGKPVVAAEGHHPRLDHVDGAWRRRASRRRAT